MINAENLCHKLADSARVRKKPSAASPWLIKRVTLSCTFKFSAASIRRVANSLVRAARASAVKCPEFVANCRSSSSVLVWYVLTRSLVCEDSDFSTLILILVSAYVAALPIVNRSHHINSSALKIPQGHDAGFHPDPCGNELDVAEFSNMGVASTAAKPTPPPNCIRPHQRQRQSWQSQFQ